MDQRKRLKRAVSDAGRENSAATVFFHRTVSEVLGLGPTDGKALDVLIRLGPMSAGELGNHTALTSASVTSLIDRLEDKGFVHRRRDPDDRRRVFVEVDQDRIERESRIFSRFQKGPDESLDLYSDDQLETIRDFLERMTEFFQTATAELTNSAPAGT